jgi:hypothetical protein
MIQGVTPYGVIGLVGALIPGWRSLRSLTRGYLPVHHAVVRNIHP